MQEYSLSSSVISTKSPLPCKVTYSQDPGIRLRTYLGDHSASDSQLLDNCFQVSQSFPNHRVHIMALLGFLILVKNIIYSFQKPKSSKSFLKSFPFWLSISSSLPSSLIFTFQISHMSICPLSPLPPILSTFHEGL